MYFGRTTWFISKNTTILDNNFPSFLMLNVGGIIHVLRGYWRSWVWAELTALQRKARGTANMIMRAERGSFVYVRELLRILPASESSSQISLKCPQEQIHYWVWTFGMYRHMYPKKKKKKLRPISLPLYPDLLLPKWCSRILLFRTVEMFYVVHPLARLRHYFFY